jgi:hypothetical protein
MQDAVRKAVVEGEYDELWAALARRPAFAEVAVKTLRGFRRNPWGDDFLFAQLLTLLCALSAPPVRSAPSTYLLDDLHPDATWHSFEYELDSSLALFVDYAKGDAPLPLAAFTRVRTAAEDLATTTQALVAALFGRVLFRIACSAVVPLLLLVVVVGSFMATPMRHWLLVACFLVAGAHPCAQAWARWLRALVRDAAAYSSMLASRARYAQELVARLNTDVRQDPDFADLKLACRRAQGLDKGLNLPPKAHV